MRRIFIAIALLAACGLAGCASRQSQSGVRNAGRASPTVAPLADPIGFPLYAGATVLAVPAGTHVIVKGTVPGNPPLALPAGTYRSREVIASTSGSFEQLRAWLNGLDDRPPAGYLRADVADLSDARTAMRRFGLDFTAFRGAGAGKPTRLLVVVMDPVQVDKRLGPLVSLLGSYESLPGPLRAPLDDAVRKRTGYSVSELMRPENPIGAAVAAMRHFTNANRRGILLVDATKQ
ncbi:MAG: hypothetical protein ACYDEK_05075 [Vulcanimicrobiaceae bacterium]